VIERRHGMCRIEFRQKRTLERFYLGSRCAAQALDGVAFNTNNGARCRQVPRRAFWLRRLEFQDLASSAAYGIGQPSLAPVENGQAAAILRN
jgi:hypothetical protein